MGNLRKAFKFPQRKRAKTAGSAGFSAILRYDTEDSIVLTGFADGKLVNGLIARKAAMMASTESDLVRCSVWKILKALS